MVTPQLIHRMNFLLPVQLHWIGSDGNLSGRGLVDRATLRIDSWDAGTVPRTVSGVGSMTKVAIRSTIRLIHRPSFSMTEVVWEGHGHSAHILVR